MKMIRAVFASAVLAAVLSSCAGDVPQTESSVGALTPSSLPFTCGEPPAVTPDMSGNYGYEWPIDNAPFPAYHGHLVLSSSADGHVWGTLTQPIEYTDPWPWDWKVFGTQNGSNLFLFAIPNPHCCDDAWFFELTKQSDGTISGHEYAGYDHNEENFNFRFKLTHVGAPNSRILAHGTPHMCPLPAAIPFDGTWTFAWNPGFEGHYCQSGSVSNPVYAACSTSGRQLTLFSEYNDGYLLGYMDPNEHGLIWGIQNGTSLQMMWSPTTFRDDPPWWFEGAYNDRYGYSFVSPERTGLDHHLVTDSNGYSLAFTMSRTIVVP